MFNNRLKDYSIRPPITGLQGGLVGVQDSDSINFSLLLGNILTAVLTDTGVTVGTYGDSTHVPVITVDSQGRITSITTVAISGGGGGTYTVDNGLTENPANNFQWGGPLVQNTDITNSGYYLRFTQSLGKALELYSNDAEALLAQRANTSRNTVDTIIRAVRKSTTNPLGIWTQSGFGASFDFDLMMSNGTTVTAGQIISKWDSPISPNERSYLQFALRKAGVLGVKMGIYDTGAINLTDYGSGTFTDTLAYALGVNSTGDLIEYIPSTILTTDSITGDGTTGNEVKLVNDQATPAYPGVYGIDASGNKNWRSDTSVRGDIPLAWMQESYITSTNQTGVLYVPSVSKLYVCNNASNTITIYDTTNGTLLATLANTGAFQAFYIASIDEVWVTSSSLTTINRISTSSNASITTISGATANGVDCVEYSSTKVYISVQNATGRIMLLNPFTINVTNAVSSSVTLNVPSNPIGMCLNTNASSAQYNHIILSCGGGVAIYDPTTDAITTTLTNPSSAIPSSAISSGKTIKYITSTDQYAIANSGNLNIVILDIASATTFTVNSTIRQMAGIQDLCVDETNGYIFTTVSGLTSANTLFMTIIDLTTKLVKLTIPTNVICGASTAAGKISLDQSNTRMFVCGRSSVANVVSAIKYV